MRIASRTFVLGAVVLGLGAAVGCGSSNGNVGTGGASSTSSSTTSSSTSGLTAMQACQDEAHAICTLRDRCSVNGSLNQLIWGSESACEMRTILTCLASVQAPGSGLTPAHVETCAGAYPSYACTDFFDNTPPAACVPPGSVANGGACGANAQCTSGNCDRTGSQLCGTCQPLLAAGASCQSSNDCGGDLTCAIPAGMTKGTCVSFVPSGGSCLTGTAPCHAGYACVGEDVPTGTMGKCTADASSVGAACDATHKTLPPCDLNMGLVCIPSGSSSSSSSSGGGGPGKCATITFAGAGQPCGPMGTPVTGVTDCSAGGMCVNGVCVAPAADGAACDSAKGPPCLSPAKCVPTGTGTAGTCTLSDPTKCH